MKLNIFILIISLFCSIKIIAQDSAINLPKSDLNVDLLWGIKIPMRDGVNLNGTIYKPTNTPRAPVIITLTPYIADNYHERAMYFARHGYIFVVVDSRGRGNSEGEFLPFAQEPKDTYDIIEWIANQDWSNGKIAMWGGSYGGYNQWAAIKNKSYFLMTIVPAAAAYPGIDFPFFQNIFMSYAMQWITLTSGLTGNSKVFNEQLYWISKYRDFYFKHQSFNTLDAIVGNKSEIFHQWLAHPVPDDYWESMSPEPIDYASLDIPILTITGHYDDDQVGALTYYRKHMQYGSIRGKAKHFLIIGPWDHAGTRTPVDEFGGLKFSPASVIDLNQLHKDWYDWILKNGKKPKFLTDRVVYYVAGSETWKHASSLEAISKHHRLFYLHSDGKANDVFHSGTLNENKSNREVNDTYIYNPLDTRPGENEVEEVKNYITDQHGVLNLFGNGLIYHTEPFDKEIEIAGHIRLVAWMAMDVPDTDFQVRLYEILPDGTSIFLTGDQLRARYKNSLHNAQWVKLNEISQYEFKTFQFFARRIAKGSRLRLVLKCPNTIYLEKNYNTKGVVSEASNKESNIAHISLYHDATHLSFLDIPTT